MQAYQVQKPENEKNLIQIEEAICWNDYEERKLWNLLAYPYKRGRTLRSLRHLLIEIDQDYYKIYENIIEVEL